MSTAGKVLVVIVLIMVPIWMVLFSGVTELNKSGTQAVEKLRDQVVKLEEDVARTEREVKALKDQIDLEQTTRGHETAVLRARQSDAEKARAELIEMQTRVKNQVADIEAALKNAQASREMREAEKKAEIKAKADAETDVKRLMAEHAELTDQLEKLRADFKETLESNRELAARLSRAGKKPGS